MKAIPLIMKSVGHRKLPLVHENSSLFKTEKTASRTQKLRFMGKLARNIKTVGSGKTMRKWKMLVMGKFP